MCGSAVSRTVQPAVTADTTRRTHQVLVSQRLRARNGTFTSQGGAVAVDTHSETTQRARPVNVEQSCGADVA